MPDLTQVVCPHCATVNRLPQARLADRGKCGKCHRPLFDGHPAAVGAAAFERHIGQSGIPVLVDFWAPWCGPCRAMAPEYEKAAARLEPGIRALKLDTEAEPELAAQFGIRSIPTLILFAGGREIARSSGAMSEAGLVSWAEAQAAPYRAAPYTDARASR